MGRNKHYLGFLLFTLLIIMGLRVIEWVVFSIFYISLSMQVSILSLRYSSSRNP